jgi:hypothetical protein
MTAITEKQLIDSLKQLKEIKPNKQWASSLKSTLLENKVPGRMTGSSFAQKVSFMDILSSVFTQRKLAYSFASILLLAVGVFGASDYLGLLSPINNVAEQSSAGLTAKVEPNKNVVDLNNKINELAKATKANSVAVADINIKVSELAKNLKSTEVNDPQVIKEITKTLASISGTDLSANPDVKDLYQTIVQNEILEQQKTTLSDSQKKVLAEVQTLYDEGEYYQAFEKILLDQQVNTLP